MSDVDDGVDVLAWQSELERVGALIVGRFGRAEPRRQVGAYLRGAAGSPLERKNSWTLAEYADAVSLDGTQRLVCSAGWSVSAHAGTCSISSTSPSLP